MSLNEPYMNVNQMIKNNNDYLTMGNKPEADYLDMKSDDDNYINTKGRPPASPSDYSNMTSDTGAIELVPIMRSDEPPADIEPADYINVDGKLQLRLPGARRDTPSPSSTDDISDVCATPPPSYNLVVSIEGSESVSV